MNASSLFKLVKNHAQSSHIVPLNVETSEKKHPTGNSITHLEKSFDSFILKTSSPITLFLINYTAARIEQGYVNNYSTAYDSFPTDYYDFNTPHTHDCIEFFYVLSGYIDVQVNNELRRFSAGTACIINQNVKLLEHYTVDSVTIYISLTNDYVKRLYDNNQKNTNNPIQKFLIKNQSKNNVIEYIDFLPIKEGVYGELWRAIYFLANEMILKKEGFQTISKGIIQRIFYYLQLGSHFYCTETTLDMEYSNHIYKEIVKYIQDRRYYMTRKEIATALNYNEDYLNWIFQKEAHQNMGAYIRNVYLEEACRLLATTDMSISHIIERLRLSNRTSFYNQFQKKYGTTPAKFREKCLNLSHIPE